MKRNIIRKYFFVFVALGAVLSSCTEDFLTETNPNELSSDSYWRNLNDTQSGLTAVYASFLNHFILNLPEEGCRSDMGWPGYGRPAPNGSGPVEYYYQTFTSTSPSVMRRWQALYLGIFRANQVIEGLNKIESTLGSDEEIIRWQTQMGQARFFRGLYHFYLYQSYNNGSVIIRDKVAVTEDEINKPLSAAEEVLEFVLLDLEYAYEFLPAKYEIPADIGRVTKGAAATILGNLYLYEGDYETAKGYYNDIINNVTAEYGYELLNDPEQIFARAAEFNSESILEISYSTDYRAELSHWDEESLKNRYANVMVSVTGPLTPAWLAYAYKTEQMDPKYAKNYYFDDKSGENKLRNVPLRCAAMISVVEDEQSMWYDKTVTDGVPYSWNGWGFSRTKKYTNHLHLLTENDEDGTSWSTGKNVIVNRLAEVYINMAECIVKTGGDIQDALDLINANHKRHGLVLLGHANGDNTRTYDEVDYTTESLMDYIIYTEKPLELSNEGYMTRWIDMRRWGIATDRFADLASRTYYLVDYKTSGGATKGFASLVETVPAGYTGGAPKLVDYEYKETTLNYKPAVNDYFGIPSVEVGVNSSIGN